MFKENCYYRWKNREIPNVYVSSMKPFFDGNWHLVKQIRDDFLYSVKFDVTDPDYFWIWASSKEEFDLIYEEMTPWHYRIKTLKELKEDDFNKCVIQNLQDVYGIEIRNALAIEILSHEGLISPKKSDFNIALSNDTDISEVLIDSSMIIERNPVTKLTPQQLKELKENTEKKESIFEKNGIPRTTTQTINLWQQPNIEKIDFIELKSKKKYDSVKVFDNSFIELATKK